MSKENKRLFQTIFISGIATVFSYLINFLLTPYISNHVGIEAYGFVSIAKTAVSYAQIITVALTTFIVRYITLNYHKNKIEEANSYYSSSILACFQLSGALLIFALLCIFKLEYLLKIPEKLIPSVKALFIFVFINFVLTTIVTPLNASCFIKNRLDLNGIVKIISYIAESVVLVVVFRYCTADIWVVGFGSFIAAIVLVGGNYILKQKLTPELKFRKKLVSYKRVKEMMSNGVWQSVNSLGNTLNSGLDLLISNLMLTAVQTGQIAVVKTIGTMFSMLYQVVSQPFQPRMLKMYSTGNKEQFFNELTKAMRICGYFSNVAFAGFVVLGWTYFKLWIPNEDANILYVLAILTIISSVTEGVVQPLYYINTLTLKKKIPCLVTIGGGLLNVLFMYLLLKYTNLGIYSIVVTTAVIMTVINFVFTPMYAAYSIKLQPLGIYKVLIRHICSVIIMVVIFKGITLIYMPHNWAGLILEALIMALLGIIIHGVTMLNKTEKDKELKKLHQIAQKIMH